MSKKNCPNCSSGGRCKECDKETRILSWNVHGFSNPALSREGVSTRAMARQDNISATADYAEEFDVVVLQETWLKENPFERLLRDWRWETIASRDPLGTRGRNRGGFIFGWRRNVPSRNIRSSLEGNSEWVSVELLVNGRWIQVVGLYRHSSTRFEDLTIPFNRDLPILLVGDMNARTADREASPAPSPEGRRRSRDMSLTSDRAFLGFLRENGLEILNGAVDGDREGEFTHRHGSNVQSTIDYATANEAMRQQIRELTVDQTRRESDHFPLTMSLGPETGKGKETDKEEEEDNKAKKLKSTEKNPPAKQGKDGPKDPVTYVPDPSDFSGAIISIAGLTLGLSLVVAYAAMTGPMGVIAMKGAAKGTAAAKGAGAAAATGCAIQ